MCGAPFARRSTGLRASVARRSTEGYICMHHLLAGRGSDAASCARKSTGLRASCARRSTRRFVVLCSSIDSAISMHPLLAGRRRGYSLCSYPRWGVLGTVFSPSRTRNCMRGTASPCLNAKHLKERGREFWRSFAISRQRPASGKPPKSWGGVDFYFTVRSFRPAARRLLTGKGARNGPPDSVSVRKSENVAHAPGFQTLPL